MMSSSSNPHDRGVSSHDEEDPSVEWCRILRGELDSRMSVYLEDPDWTPMRKKNPPMQLKDILTMDTAEQLDKMKLEVPILSYPLEPRPTPPPTTTKSKWTMIPEHAQGVPGFNTSHPHYGVIKRFTLMALEKYNDSRVNKSHFKFVQIESVAHKLVQGVIYYITFQAESPNMRLGVFEAIVHVDNVRTTVQDVWRKSVIRREKSSIKAFTTTAIEVPRREKSAVKVEEMNIENIEEDQFNGIYCTSPEQMEELRELSQHYGLLFHRWIANMSLVEKDAYRGKLEEVEQILDFRHAIYKSGVGSDEETELDTTSESIINEMKNSSVKRSAELTQRCCNLLENLAGLSPEQFIPRFELMLRGLLSKGVYWLVKMMNFAVKHLLMLGRSIISKNIDWPEDPVERAKIIRSEAQSINDDLEVVFQSFITAISAVERASMEIAKPLARIFIRNKARKVSDILWVNHDVASTQVAEGAYYLSYVVASNLIRRISQD